MESDERTESSYDLARVVVLFPQSGKILSVNLLWEIIPFYRISLSEVTPNFPKFKEKSIVCKLLVA
jgi:hypothetical protein